MKATAAEFKKASLTTGERAKQKFAEAERLRAEADAVEAEGRAVSDRFGKAMSEYVSKLRFMDAAPWLRTATADQIILGIGDDEYLVCAAPDYILHHYGKPSESGHRYCDGLGDHDPHGGVILESYDLAVLGEPITAP